jgi:hypothetical protein
MRIKSRKCCSIARGVSFRIPGGSPSDAWGFAQGLNSTTVRAGDPWATLGWVHWSEAQQAWVHDVAFKSWAGGVAVVLGCVLTGLSLGFGSRFWHDILEIVLDTSEAIKARVPRKARADASAAGGGSGEKS